MKKWIILILAMLCVVNVYATDNVAVTAGTGTTIAAEDVSGVKYQKVKLIDATASSTTPTGVAASPLQVSLANTGTNGTAVAVSVATIPSHAVTNAGTFATQATLQAGTAEIGKLAAGTAEIGNVKNSGTFATQATLQAGTAEVGKLAAGTAEIGNVKNSGTFAVQAAQSTASNLKTEAHLYDSSTNGIGSTSNALDINIKSGNPTTITATQGTDTNFKTAASCYQGGSAVSATNPLYTQIIQPDKTIVAAYTASQTGGTVLTPTSGKKAIITDITISASGAGTIVLFDNTDSASTEITPVLTFAANGGYVYNGRPITSAAANNVIKYTSGSGSAGSVLLHYYEI
jgi:hypothetical protein